MKFLYKTLFLLSFIICSPVYANLFEYSFSFSTDQMIHGSFTGHQNGLFVADVDNAQAYLRQFAGLDSSYNPVYTESTLSNEYTNRGAKLNVFGLNPETHSYDSNFLPLISQDILVSNFEFACACGDDFYVFNDGLAFPFHLVYVFDDSAALGVNGDFRPSNERWKLVDLPEPNLIALFLFGFFTLLLANNRTGRFQGTLNKYRS